MTSVWPPIVLVLLVAGLWWARRLPALEPLFRWLPLPLWCYAVPMAFTAWGWLPTRDPSYQLFTHALLPIALALLLLGVNLRVLLRTSPQALIAAAVGTGGIVLGTVGWTWWLRAHLPADAWQGAGCLAATWTGGSLNLLAMRTLLDTPEAIFTPLLVVDTIIAYGWMALLVAGSGVQDRLNAWLRAPQLAVASEGRMATAALGRGRALWCTALLAVGLALGARWVAGHLPTTALIASVTGWTVLLVTTSALGLSNMPAIQRVAARGEVLGYPCLYLVLAAMGAQASVAALHTAPAWLLVGLGTVLVHGGLLLIAGRLWQIPIGVLATASQSNLGGFVSGPLVGGIYHRSLPAVGLILAMAGSAVGTYVGWLSASLTRWLAGS